MYDSKRSLQETRLQGHWPFALRKVIVFAGIFAGLISYFLLNNGYLALCIYLIAITLADQAVHYLVPIRASLLVNPKQLLSHEEISPEDLDRHYAAKTHIRLISLGIALVSQLFFFSPFVFLGAFAVATLVGRLYTRYHLDIVGPKVVHEMSQEEVKKWSNEQHEDVTRGLLGFGPYSSLKDNHHP